VAVNLPHRLIRKRSLNLDVERPRLCDQLIVTAERQQCINRQQQQRWIGGPSRNRDSGA